MDVRPFVARVGLGSAGVVALWLLLVYLARHQPVQTRLALIGLAHSLSAALLLCAAALRFAAWRITGRARTAWSAIVLAVAGFALPVVELTIHLAGSATAGVSPAALPRDLAHLSLICLGVVALRMPDVVARLRPMRVVAPFLLGCVVIAAIVTARGPSPFPSESLQVTVTVTHWTVAVAWALLSAAFVASGRRHHRPTDIGIGVALVVMVAGAVLRVVLAPGTFRTLVGPAGAMLFTTTMLAGLSAMALWQLQTGRGTRLLRVTGELNGARVDLQNSERDQAGRLHDARSAILAVAGATRMLAQPESAHGVDRDRLQGMVSAELARLGALLDPAHRSTIRRFRPAEVIEPLVLAHRLSGADIVASLSHVWALGMPDATATAVANLLSNVRAHAAGARVWVSVDGGDAVTITVADDGPGIPCHERALVLQPGVRGAAATGPGTGIGLASAAQSMAAQGGSLRITQRPGGGTSVRLTLPLAPRAPGPLPERAQGREVGMTRVVPEPRTPIRQRFARHSMAGWTVPGQSIAAQGMGRR